MEISKAPGIAIQGVFLLRSNVELGNLQGKPECCPCLTSLDRKFSEDGKTLRLYAGFDMMFGIQNPIFKFTCDFVAIYGRDDSAEMSWDAFTSPIALAHIIPYLREYVSNITNRLPIPVLILDPINTHKMIAEYEERKRQGEAKAAVAGEKAISQVPQAP